MFKNLRKQIEVDVIYEKFQFKHVKKNKLKIFNFRNEEKLEENLIPNSKLFFKTN